MDIDPRGAKLDAMSTGIGEALDGHDVGDCLTVLAHHVAAAIATNTDSTEGFTDMLQTFNTHVIARGLDCIVVRHDPRKVN